MTSTQSARYLPAGESALIVEFGNAIDKSLVDAVSNLRSHIEALQESQRLTGVLETIPTFRSLAIIIDPLHTSIDAVSYTHLTLPTNREV